MKRAIFLGTVLLMLAGCLISRKVSFNIIHVTVPALNQTIAIATVDQREQVIDGSRKLDFVGYTRSPYGMAFPIGTLNGKSFADNMSASIKSSFSSTGSNAESVSTNVSETEADILNKLKKTGSNRLILINCKRCYTDGVSPSLLYDIKVSIYTEKGIILKQKTFEGRESLGGLTWGTSKNAAKHISAGYESLLQQIFNDDEIVTALKNI